MAREGSEGPWSSHGLSHPQIWYLLEGSYQVYKLFPSKGWELYLSLQLMQQSSLYAPNETMITLFYDDSKLYQVPGGGLRGRLRRAAGWRIPAPVAPAFPLQLVYLIDKQQGRLVKRLVPVEQLLMYQQLGNHYLLEQQG